MLLLYRVGLHEYIQIHNYIWTCTCAKVVGYWARKQKQAIPNTVATTAVSPLNMNLTERRALHNSIVICGEGPTSPPPSIHPDQASKAARVIHQQIVYLTGWMEAILPGMPANQELELGRTDGGCCHRGCGLMLIDMQSARVT